MNAVLILHDATPKGYSIIKWGEYPSSNPNVPLEVLPGFENYEWLVPFEVQTTQEYDPRIWQINQTQMPTTIKHPNYPIINQWLIQNTLSKRTNEEIIQSIRDAEANANSTLLLESEKDKLFTMATACNYKLQKGILLNAQEQAVMDRMVEVNAKMWQNAQIAENKINLVIAGNEPNIDSDWIIDDLTTQGFPFSE